MTDSDDDFDIWLATMQGKPGKTDPMASALREAIQTEQEEQESNLQEEAELAKLRLLKRLRQEGLLGEKPIKRQRWLITGLSTAAIIALSVSVALNINKYSPRPPVDETFRGAIGTIKINSTDTVSKASEIMESLKSMKLDPTEKTIEDGVEIQVEVKDFDLPQFSPWFKARGGRAVSPGRYTFLIIEGEE